MTGPSPKTCDYDANHHIECLCGNELQNELQPVEGDDERSDYIMLCAGAATEPYRGPNRLNLYGVFPATTPTPAPEPILEVTPTPG